MFVILNKNCYNPAQNIWNKMEESTKTGQDKKSLVYILACLFTATATVEAGRHAMCPLKFEILLVFPDFLRS